jgi:hypothetical protein
MGLRLSVRKIGPKVGRPSLRNSVNPLFRLVFGRSPKAGAQLEKLDNDLALAPVQELFREHHVAAEALPRLIPDALK